MMKCPLYVIGLPDLTTGLFSASTGWKSRQYSAKTASIVMEAVNEALLPKR